MATIYDNLPRNKILLAILNAYADSNISIAPSSTTIRNQLVTGPAMLWIIAEP